jgi:hypothetical protein
LNPAPAEEENKEVAEAEEKDELNLEEENTEEVKAEEKDELNFEEEHSEDDGELDEVKQEDLNDDLLVGGDVAEISDSELPVD